jgi:hypothetical protein
VLGWNDDDIHVMPTLASYSHLTVPDYKNFKKVKDFEGDTV